LYIGTGSRTSGGEINIGTGANLANNLYIGHKGTTVSTQVVRINTSTGAGVGSTVIGSATSGTNIIGNAGVGGNLTVTGSITASDLITADGGLRLNAGDLITANGGLTIGGAYGITLTSTPYTPISTQLGYFGRAYNSLAVVNYSTGAIGNDIVNTGTNIGIGIYQMMWTVSVNNWTNGTSAYMNFSFNTAGAISMYGVPQTSGNLPPTSGSDFIMQLQGVTNSNTQFATFNFSCIVKSTLASQEINLRGKINAGTNTATTPIGYGQVTYIKIA